MSRVNELGTPFQTASGIIDTFYSLFRPLAFTLLFHESFSVANLVAASAASPALGASCSVR